MTFLKTRLLAFNAFGDESDSDETRSQSIQDSPEFQEALRAGIQQAIEAETSGLKNKLSEVLGEKKTLAEQLNSIAMQAEDERDQQDLKNGKLDVQTLLDRKIAARDQTWQQRLQDEQAEKEAYKQAIESERSKLKQFQVKQFVINEALKNEFFHPSAAEDLASIAMNSWDLTESGELISRDRDGNIAIGRNGGALTPKEWVESLQKTRPHYFKSVAGSGSRPGASGSVKTFTRQEWQAELSTANPAKQKELMAKRAKGEIVIN